MAGGQLGVIILYRQIAYSTNGGRTFSAREFPVPANVNAVTFPDAKHGYLVGEHGMIYRYHIVPADYTAKGMILHPWLLGTESANILQTRGAAGDRLTDATLREWSSRAVKLRGTQEGWQGNGRNQERDRDNRRLRGATRGFRRPGRQFTDCPNPRGGSQGAEPSSEQAVALPDTLRARGDPNSSLGR